MSTSGTKFRQNDGDWVCPDPQCGNLNFARRSTCNLCDQEKSDTTPKKKLGHEIGKAAAEKSRGLFSADDWQCGRCGNVNWARRQQCNMCNAPKFGEVEERTGLGGGYNERESVEYIEREESDEEYDDFGRKRKKKLEEEKKSPPNNSREKKDETEEDDEEDDDDDDADLSKYDLSGWGEDETEETDPKDAEKDSKTRSSSSESKKSTSSSDSDHSRSHKHHSEKRRRHSRSRSRSPLDDRKRRYKSSHSGSGSKERDRSRSPHH